MVKRLSRLIKSFWIDPRRKGIKSWEKYGRLQSKFGVLLRRFLGSRDSPLCGNGITFVYTYIIISRECFQRILYCAQCTLYSTHTDTHTHTLTIPNIFSFYNSNCISPDECLPDPLLIRSINHYFPWSKRRSFISRR